MEPADAWSLHAKLIEAVRARDVQRVNQLGLRCRAVSILDWRVCIAARVATPLAHLPTTISTHPPAPPGPNLLQVPGLKFEVEQVRMDLLYAKQYAGSLHAQMPEAYEPGAHTQCTPPSVGTQHSMPLTAEHCVCAAGWKARLPWHVHN